MYCDGMARHFLAEESPASPARGVNVCPRVLWGNSGVAVRNQTQPPQGTYVTSADRHKLAALVSLDLRSIQLIVQIPT